VSPTQDKVANLVLLYSLRPFCTMFLTLPMFALMFRPSNSHCIPWTILLCLIAVRCFRISPWLQRFYRYYFPFLFWESLTLSWADLAWFCLNCDCLLLMRFCSLISLLWTSNSLVLRPLFFTNNPSKNNFLFVF